MSFRWKHSRPRRSRSNSHSRRADGHWDYRGRPNLGNTEEQRARKLREQLQQFEPPYSCLALYLSSRLDLLPAEYCRELAMTGIVAQPLSPTAVQRLFANELGNFLDKSFECIDYSPVDCTLTTQSHHARLRTGRLVTLVVVRPEYYALENNLEWTEFLNPKVLDKVVGEFGLEDALRDFTIALRRKTNLCLTRETM